MTQTPKNLDWLRDQVDTHLALTCGYALEDLQLRINWSADPEATLGTSSRGQQAALRTVLADADRYESLLVPPAAGSAARPKNGSDNVRVYRHREIGGNAEFTAWVKPQLLAALQGQYGLRVVGLVRAVEWAAAPLQDVGCGLTRDYVRGFGPLLAPDVRARAVEAALIELHAANLVYPESSLSWEAGKRQRQIYWRPGVPRAPEPITPERIKENRRRFFTGLG